MAAKSLRNSPLLRVEFGNAYKGSPLGAIVTWSVNPLADVESYTTNVDGIDVFVARTGASQFARSIQA